MNQIQKDTREMAPSTWVLIDADWSWNTDGLPGRVESNTTSLFVHVVLEMSKICKEFKAGKQSEGYSRW